MTGWLAGHRQRSRRLGQALPLGVHPRAGWQADVACTDGERGAARAYVHAV
jgi:hypothetical protein